MNATTIFYLLRRSVPLNSHAAAWGLGASAFLIAASTSHAENLAPGSSDDEVAIESLGKPLWEVGLAAGAASFADYPGSNRYESRVLPLPFFIYRGGVLRSDASGPRIHTQVGDVDLEFSGGGALSSNATGGAREGMPKLDNLIEFGPSAKVTLTKPTPTSRWLIDLPLRAAVSTDFSSRLNWRGFTFAPDVAYEDTAMLGSRWGGRVSLGVEATTAQLQRFWYQVDPQYATEDRPAYTARAGYLGSRLTLSMYRPITTHFNVYVSADLDSYEGAENRDSPLFKSRAGFGVIVGFSWSIRQSEKRE